eukprot:CAMPEP_0115872312 /NCGR_PEP_ID=MMETSP0287-20121206/23353_1 /TAXON_ID=412157 /ORGANISM="Chrysochromulina rotalis, Strain UIO044" /LENGTH=138 /DNA_ID=CAMNT_0003327213 /DNA_START=366 /DNA_END=782 /DNA_ORIENTATION=-
MAPRASRHLIHAQVSASRPGVVTCGEGDCHARLDIATFGVLPRAYAQQGADHLPTSCMRRRLRLPERKERRSYLCCLEPASGTARVDPRRALLQVGVESKKYRHDGYTLTRHDGTTMSNLLVECTTCEQSEVIEATGQ